MSTNETPNMLLSHSDYVSMDKQQEQQGENVEPADRIEVSIGGQPSPQQVWNFGSSHEEQLRTNETPNMLLSHSYYVSMDKHQEQQGENVEPADRIEVSIGGQPSPQQVWNFGSSHEEQLQGADTPVVLPPPCSSSDDKPSLERASSSSSSSDHVFKLQDASKLRLEYVEKGKRWIYQTDSEEEDYLGKSQTFSQSRWQRCKAEIVDVTRELLHYTKTKSWKKKFLTVVVCSSSLLVFCDLLFFHHIVHWLREFIMWMETHIIQGFFAFLVLFTITTLVFIPPSILTFWCGYTMAHVCGLLPGIIVATMACFIGSVVGAMISFLRARYMMRDLVHLFARRYTIVRAADKAIKRNGFRVMVLLRLCPLIPFHALNYIGGITGVSWRAFLFSLVGILPITILTITIGATTGDLVKRSRDLETDDQRLVSILLMCSGLAFVIIAVAITYYFAKKELQLELAAAAAENSSTTELNEKEGVEVIRIETEEVEDEEWFWMFT